MTSTLAAHRVKLKNHVYFGIVADGILFDAGDSSFIIKDKATYPVVEKLVALIDSGHSPEDIMERAPQKVAELFRKVLGLLDEHGMLLTVEADAPSAEDLAVHTPANELRKFLEDRLDGRAVGAALLRWSTAHVVVAGSGLSLLTAVKAFSQLGCGKVTVVADGGALDGLDGLQREIAASPAGHTRVETAVEQDVTLGQADLLAYVSDAMVAAWADRLEMLMRAGAIPGVIGAVIAGQACVLPISQRDRPGLADLLHWLKPRDDDAATLGPVAKALLGSVAAHAALTRFFGVEAAGVRGQVAMVEADLEVGYCMLVASAADGGAPAPFIHPTKYEIPKDRPMLPFEHIRYALEPWFDPTLGPFSVVASDDIEQVPLMQFPIRVRSAIARGGDTLVVGWGLEHAAAVVRGLSMAVEALASGFRQDGVAIICDFDEARWKQRALACAVAVSEDMRLHHRWAWVDLAHLPPGPARMLHDLLRFHAPEGLRAQLQWDAHGGAYIVHLLQDETALCTVVEADPLSALEEALGKACSVFQLRHLPDARFDPGLRLPAREPAFQVDDWQEALRVVAASQTRHAEFHLLATPGLPPAVYCGHATIGSIVSAS